MNIKFQKLNLPVFSGNYKEWTSFYDLFNGAVIDNIALQCSRKLLNSESSLKDAEKLLVSIPVTDHFFDVAMEILVNRYEN